ncbi:MAG TPA: ABC transporter permease [Chloroflexota bacterium]|nr:ABC transporter permease [Chloroflexota bacterium]
MTRYLLRRVFEALPLLFLITVAVFFILQLLPAGPLSVYENDPALTTEDLKRLEERFGLNDPIPVRYLKWLGALVQGELGYSLVTHQQVAAMIGERLPNTIYLMTVALGVTLLIALPIGVISAIRQYSWLDHLATLFSFVGYATPPFWSGLLVIILFSVKFREWGLPSLPASGMFTLGSDGGVADRIVHLILPVGVLALFNAAHYTRYVRASMLEVVHQDYVRTARAKGLADRSVIWAHALKNAALPVVTVIALDLPMLFSGAVVTESIFAWPGMGRLFLESAFRFDYAVLMGVVTITAGLVILSTLLADVIYAWLDPRIRLS